MKLQSYFQLIDWVLVLVFLALLVGIGVFFQRKDAKNAQDYFLAGKSVPSWLAAISTIATMQSAATFLGAPDIGFRGDFTYLGTNLGTILAAIFVGFILIPRFYAMNASTVYELLAKRYSQTAMRWAGGMFLIGRVFAEGSRIYLAAIAVSMMIFSGVSFYGIAVSAALIIVFSFGICFFGGLRSVIWTDVVLFFVYLGASVGSLIYLIYLIPADLDAIISGLKQTPEGINKLRLFDFSLDFSKPFSFWAIVTGMFLLSLASFGLDQDISQRLLASKDAKTGTRSLYMASILTLPIVAVFIAIGSLLYVFYQRPDLMGANVHGTQETLSGEKVSAFMYFIMTQIPPGLRAMATIGVLAAAISTVNSGLNSMSSVLIQDFYRPLILRHNKKSDHHFVDAGRIGMAIIGLFLFAMAVLSYFWQKSTNIPLIQFALGVMTFAYAGLLGVYFTAIFTKRGSTLSVILALIIGFLSILLMQPYFAKLFHYPQFFQTLAFPWQLCIGTIISFFVCFAGDKVENAVKN